MSKTQLQENNARLTSLIETLSGKAAGGSGGSIEYEIVTIPAGIDVLSIPHSLARVTNAYGCPSGSITNINSEGVLTGVRDNTIILSIDLYYDPNSGAINVELGSDYITYSNGLVSGYLSYTSQNSLQVILINDPSKDALI